MCHHFGFLRMKIQPNAQYNIARPDSLAVRIATLQRRKMFDLFLKETQISETDTVLDIGVTSDQSYSSSNYLEAWLKNKSRITAAGIDDASFLEKLYPGLKFVYANGLDLPFEDKCFDYVHSSAVLEHVGSFYNQSIFIKECLRVARKAIFITTPDRCFPIELHTVLPFVHWLPKPLFRKIMLKTGRDFFADENNLNLMTYNELFEAAYETTNEINVFTQIKRIRLILLSSNLILICKRHSHEY